jgi:hypothetical protein
MSSFIVDHESYLSSATKARSARPKEYDLKEKEKEKEKRKKVNQIRVIPLTMISRFHLKMTALLDDNMLYTSILINIYHCKYCLSIKLRSSEVSIDRSCSLRF